MIKKRNVFLFFLFSILTCGIYTVIVYCNMGKEINKICEGDGKEQMNYFLAFLLGMVTFGIYPIVWVYKAMSRLDDNGYRYNVDVKHKANDYLLWLLVGSLLCGVGSFVAIYYFIDSVNQFSEVYGVVQPLEYTNNSAERARLISQQNFGSNSQTSPGPNPGPKPGIRNNGQIVCVRGTYSGAQVPIANETAVTIGRDPAYCDFVLDNSFTKISGRHVSIRFHGSNNSYDVTDFSTNGTFLNNGTRLRKDMPQNFPAGTEIYLADGENAFRLN